MKKTIITFTLTALMVTALPMTALAHGHHNSGDSPSRTYTLCPVENCNVSEIHQHDQVTYCGHTTDDGHDFHQACSVNGCTRTGEHSHNGTTCQPHSSTAGHSHGKHHGNGSHH